jgi:hypothetical protein
MLDGRFQHEKKSKERPPSLERRVFSIAASGIHRRLQGAAVREAPRVLHEQRRHALIAPGMHATDMRENDDVPRVQNG